MNEDRARDRINDQMTHSSQAYWDLPEKTLSEESELIRMPLKGNIDPVAQEKRQVCGQDMAGSELIEKATVEMTYDEIAGAYSEEEDPPSVFGSTKRSQSDYKSRITVTHDAYSHMHWETRMRWLDVAVLDASVLHPGDTLQSMGLKEIMVRHGDNHMLVGTAYGRILETMGDENIEWYASVIKKA